MQQMNTAHRSLEKALEILLPFVPHNAEIGTIELSKALGFHRSTVNRLLHVLEKGGFAEQNPDTKKFGNRACLEGDCSDDLSATQLQEPCYSEKRASRQDYSWGMPK